MKPQWFRIFVAGSWYINWFWGFKFFIVEFFLHFWRILVIQLNFLKLKVAYLILCQFNGMISSIVWSLFNFLMM